MSALSAIAAAIAAKEDSEPGVLICGDTEIRLWLVEGEHYLALKDIGIYPQGQGLGTQVMEALRAYACANDKSLTVEDIANRPFFDRFDWLVPSPMFSEEELEDPDCMPHYELSC